MGLTLALQIFIEQISYTKCQSRPIKGYPDEEKMTLLRYVQATIIQKRCAKCHENGMHKTSQNLVKC